MKLDKFPSRRGSINDNIRIRKSMERNVEINERNLNDDLILN